MSDIYPKHYVMANGDDITMSFDDRCHGASRFVVRQQSCIDNKIFTRYFGNIADANRAYNRGIA